MSSSQDILSFILNPHFSGNLQIAFLTIKIFMIVLSASLLGFIIYALVATTWLRRMILWDLQEFLTYRPYGVRRLMRQWLRVKARLDTGMESEYKLAVMEADSILDETLAKMGFSGKSLGERLEKLSAASLSNIDDVKRIHAIRNNIIHDPNYRLSLDDARKAIEVYEIGLTDLQAL